MRSGAVEQLAHVGARRRVDDDQLVAVLLQQLVQLLHRHVLGRAAELAGQLLIEAVGEDALGDRRARRDARDQVIEGALGVERQRLERRRRRRRARRARLARQLAEAERVLQAARRIDGDHRGGAAALAPAHRQRRGGGGLADPAGADADDQALREQRRRAPSRVSAAHASASPRSSAAPHARRARAASMPSRRSRAADSGAMPKARRRRAEMALGFAARARSARRGGGEQRLVARGARSAAIASRVGGAEAARPDAVEHRAGERAGRAAVERARALRASRSPPSRRGSRPAARRCAA